MVAHLHRLQETPSVTANRNVYIDAAVDHFTKMPVAHAVPEQSSETTAPFLYEDVFHQHGIPKVIIVDIGFAVLCNQLDVLIIVLVLISPKVQNTIPVLMVRQSVSTHLSQRPCQMSKL